MKKLHHATVKSFRKKLYDHFDRDGRELPWRDVVDMPDPWKVVVSEIMLQQTQVDRVVVKYHQFFEAFPTMQALANARVDELLPVWKGLGYNRRALNLQRTAQALIEQHGGEVPEDPELLMALPGIGPATCRSICVYAYNQPELFIETNVRAVYIHHFFEDRVGVHDDELLPYLEQTIDTQAPAKFYSALMDYGTQLKKRIPGIGRRSKHYTRQSTFEGSNRQLRSRMLSAVLAAPKIGAERMARELGADQTQVETNLIALCKEGFLCKEGDGYRAA